MATAAPTVVMKLFETAIARHASDIHLAAGQVPTLRITGHLERLDDQGPLGRDVLLQEMRRFLPPPAMAAFEQHRDVDASFELPNKERFRVSVYWKCGQPALAARRIPSVIPSLDELEAPQAALDFVELTQGIVLVTGPTGAGKSTLLAGMIEHINQTKVKHIITLEDPIEFVYEPKSSLVSQRELGTDFTSFAEGLKHMFRQDPDIALIGEMRDPETIATALTLAETGHLVFATLHTNGAAQTVERIINAFPANQQPQIRLQLSLVLKGVVSQLLLPNTEGTLTPVHEVLVMTNAVANVIRDGRTEQLQNIIYTSGQEHMVDLDQELLSLVDEGILAPDVAKEHARNSKRFV